MTYNVFGGTLSLTLSINLAGGVKYRWYVYNLHSSNSIDFQPIVSYILELAQYVYMEC